MIAETPLALHFRYTCNMVLAQRISANPQILGGRPVVEGTRLAVDLILELLAAGETEEYLLENYPNLTHEDILACISYAGQMVNQVRVLSIPA